MNTLRFLISNTKLFHIQSSQGFFSGTHAISGTCTQGKSCGAFNFGPTCWGTHWQDLPEICNVLLLLKVAIQNQFRPIFNIFISVHSNIYRTCAQKVFITCRKDQTGFIFFPNYELKCWGGGPKSFICVSSRGLVWSYTYDLCIIIWLQIYEL